MKNNNLRATPAARKLAKDTGIDLMLVTGSGIFGRIHKDDVEEYKLNGRILVSPLAKKIAEYNNLDLSTLTGTGVRGKIMKEDVLKALGLLENENVIKVQETQKEEKQIKEKAISVSEGETEVIPMSPMRKVISKRMSESYFTAPTFTLNYEVDMTEVKALREKILDAVLEQTGKKVTITDILSFAVVKTLMKHKYMNSSLSPDGTEITFHNYVNLSIAVGLDDGLLVPVVKGADKMSLSELVVASKEIVKKAVSMKLSPAEQSGSTFTISNLGMFGVQSFNPIINQPNSAILGVSATVDKPVVINGDIVVRPIMNLSLTIDHRVVDGLAGAKFMQDLKKTLENPLTMLI